MSTETADEVTRLRDALSELLDDTQHSEHDCGDTDCPVTRAQAVLAGLPDESTETLDEAWAAAEAAMTVQYPNFLGHLIDRKRHDLSVHRVYSSRLDADGNEEYEYEARATLPGIHYYPASGATPAAALRELAARLAATPALSTEAPE